MHPRIEQRRVAVECDRLIESIYALAARRLFLGINEPSTIKRAR